MTQSWYPHAALVLGPNDAASAWNRSDSSCASSYILCNGITLSASSNRPGFSHLQGVLESDKSMLRNRSDLLSVGGVGTVGMFLIDEYAGGGDLGGAMPSCGCETGIEGASLEGGGGGVAVETLSSCRGGSGGAGLGETTISVGNLDDVLRCDPGRLLNSFMRFVESVRRNWAVKSAAQVSGNESCGGGTGLRRGTPLLLWSAMVAESRLCWRS